MIKNSFEGTNESSSEWEPDEIELFVEMNVAQLPS